MKKGLLLPIIALLIFVDIYGQRQVQERFQLFPVGDIKPSGWLKDRLNQDLAGFTGRLDSLVPDLILKDDIYGKDRLTRKVKSKELGAVGEAGDWQVQLLWWNSETQSNWWDGYIRSAIMTGSPQHLRRVKDHINRILATQDEDGYLGIYDREMRYRFDYENGELWSKATLLRGLLAWYEYSKDPAVLHAAERAVRNVMTSYPIDKSHPFYSTKPDVGGLSHGLMFTDVLESLYRINGDRSLLRYAAFCYADFSAQNLNEDARLSKLLDPSLPLKGHGVHTYEHLRSLAAAYQATGDMQMKTALAGFVQKIEKTTTPTGGPVGDEWIGGRPANSTDRGYEYCSLQELMHSYLELYLKSGNASFAEKAEHLFLNAAQGARHPRESCIAYLKTDNSYFMTGGLNGDTSIKTQTRYKYSPAHQDAAVCCVPNAGRITPYFLQYAWLKDGQNLVANLLGPVELTTVIGGKKIEVREEVSFTDKQTVKFTVSGNGANFSLMIRKPSWVKKYHSSVPLTEKDGYLIVSRKWTGGQVVELSFEPAIETHRDNNGEYYFSFGPYVLAHPISATAEVSRSFPIPGFSDLKYKPNDLLIYKYSSGELPLPGEKSGRFRLNVLNPISGQKETINLEPVGNTILRQVTFKAY
ncbi:glycoside hydrolase family 127 protein [Terrimonas sp. NA20]|uniref:Glycoside hydrolase family 127 protein n=1 Tax=Terrimonas ginsenosidimutans TaxID=2908004 RepID=A0ABS9KXL0_9BACT|nr:beta-L-arabinofuranosidase domain-containing protein [Terrimonas ginsenosidimutans]MCG2617055.1 glycoside hydrolase family 127 protein [Terrimonas ginsenosidimutans]